MSNPYEARVERYDAIQRLKNTIFVKTQLERSIGRGILPADAKLMAGKYLQVNKEYYASEFDPYRHVIAGDPTPSEKVTSIRTLVVEALDDIREKEDWVKARLFFIRCSRNLELQAQKENNPIKHAWSVHFRDVAIFLRRDSGNIS